MLNYTYKYYVVYFKLVEGLSCKNKLNILLRQTCTTHPLHSLPQEIKTS